MENKRKRYIHYIKEFINNVNKDVVIKEIFKEIKEQGPITGIRSFLHKKYHKEDVVIDWEYSEAGQLLVKEYDCIKKTVLPNGYPLISIIIPMYNQVQYTCNCVSSIYDNCTLDNYEIIIADDNSDEDTSLLKNSFENLIYLRPETNQGFLMNCNLAAKRARGKYIVFLNNDTQVQPNWLEELLFIFNSFDNVGIAGSKLLYPDGSLQEAGGIVWQDGSAWNYGNADKAGKPKYCYVKEVDYVSGASMMVLKDFWDKVGGFDERYLPAYYEDSDLCFQARSHGYKVIYQPFSKAVHFEGISHGTDLATGVKKYQVDNAMKFYEKWYEILRKKSRPGERLFSERDRTIKKKHVLVVDHYLPEIDKDAGSRCISNQIDALLELGYSVKFLGENDNTSPKYRELFQKKGVEVLYGSPFEFTQKKWEQYLLNNLDKFDAILLSRSSVCIPVLEFLRKNNFQGTSIYFGHDLGFLRVGQEAFEKNDASLMAEANRLKRNEDYMYANADTSVVLSFEELTYLRKYISRPLHYIPAYYFNVVKEIPSFDQRKGIFFVGGFNHTPNQDAMKWFLDEVYLTLEQQGIYLTIAGSKMPDFIFEYKKRFPSLTILPDVSVETLDNIYKNTRISIVPLRLGAGVKGKVIEAMAKGVPVAGTDIAFEGIPKDNDFIYKGVNSVTETVNEIVRVYNNEDHWTQLSEFGRKYVSENFNKEGMKRVFRNIIEG